MKKTILVIALMILLAAWNMFGGCKKQASAILVPTEQGKKNNGHQVVESSVLPHITVTVSGNTLTWTLPDNPKWTFVQKFKSIPMVVDQTTSTSFYQYSYLLAGLPYITSMNVESGFYYRVCGSNMNDELYFATQIFVP